MCLALAKTIEVILDDCLFVLHPVLYWGGVSSCPFLQLTFEEMRKLVRC